MGPELSCPKEDVMLTNVYKKNKISVITLPVVRIMKTFITTIGLNLILRYKLGANIRGPKS